MASFKVTNKAIEDLLDIARFTEAQWGRHQRNSYLKHIDSTFYLLAENPSLGQRCDDIKLNYYKYTLRSHVIFYRHSVSARIEIIRVLHKRMDTSPLAGKNG